MAAPSVTVELTAEPSDAALSVILAGLVGFNAGEMGPAQKVPLAVLVRDTDGDPLGGLGGYTAWGWLFVEKLWLPDRLRGHRLAERLLIDAEIEASKRGCHGAWLDTFNPDALRLYQRQGYTVFGELLDFPKGRKRYFLQKSLVAGKLEA